MSKFARCPSCSWSQSVGDSVGMPFPCPRCGALVKLGKSGQSLEELEASELHKRLPDEAADAQVETVVVSEQAPQTQATLSPLAEASRFSRFLAAMLDITIEVGLAAAIVLFLHGVGTQQTQQHLYRDAGLASLIAIVLQSYVIALSGQSFGKMICGIRVANLHDDAIPDFSRTVFIRYWLPLAVSYSIPLAVIIDMLCIFGRERRCLHDLMAGTRVVQL